jgi:hypothetical protein
MKTDSDALDVNTKLEISLVTRLGKRHRRT